MSRRSDRRALDKAARESSRNAPVPTAGTEPIDLTARPVDAATTPRRLHAWRWPALILIPALIAAGFVAEREIQEDEAPVVTSGATASMPTAAAASALSSTWYCAAGTATGTDEGQAEQTVLVANESDVDRSGTITAYPEGGQPVASPLSVPAFTRATVRVSDLVQAPSAAALVEIDGGDVVVQHQLRGPAGRTISPCASAPSDSWAFPVGTSRPGASLTLTLFNPFPGEAVVDVSALSEDGVREPEAYQGLVVPGSGLLTLKVSDVITLRSELTTLVTVRSGRVVAEQVQVSDGTIVADDEGHPDPLFLPTLGEGLTAMLGAPAPAASWIFPNGVTAAGYSERYVVYNPSDTPAEVDVQVILDDPDVNGMAEPFELTIAPDTYREVELFDPNDSRVPEGVGHAVVVRSRNGVEMVAGRAISSTAVEDPVGIAYTMGAPVVATRWLAAAGALADQTASSLTIFNPSPDSPVTITVNASGEGRYDTVEGFSGVVVQPNSRLSVPFDADGLGIKGLALVVESDLPVVIESRFRLDDGDDLASFMLAPVSGTVSRPAPDVGELSTDAFVVTD